MSGRWTTTRRRKIANAVLGPSLLVLIVFLRFATGTESWNTVTQTKSSMARPELVLQTGHSKGVNCAAFGPDGSWLASGGSDNSIKIWQVENGRELRALMGHTGYVKSLATSPNGRWVASGSSDRT